MHAGASVQTKGKCKRDGEASSRQGLLLICCMFVPSHMFASEAGSARPRLHGATHPIA